MLVNPERPQKLATEKQPKHLGGPVSQYGRTSLPTTTSTTPLVPPQYSSIVTVATFPFPRNSGEMSRPIVNCGWLSLRTTHPISRISFRSRIPQILRERQWATLWSVTSLLRIQIDSDKSEVHVKIHRFSLDGLQEVCISPFVLPFSSVTSPHPVESISGQQPQNDWRSRITKDVPAYRITIARSCAAKSSKASSDSSILQLPREPVSSRSSRIQSRVQGIFWWVVLRGRKDKISTAGETSFCSEEDLLISLFRWDIFSRHHTTKGNQSILILPLILQPKHYYPLLSSTDIPFERERKRPTPPQISTKSCPWTGAEGPLQISKRKFNTRAFTRALNSNPTVGSFFLGRTYSTEPLFRSRVSRPQPVPTQATNYQRPTETNLSPFAPSEFIPQR